MPFHRKKFCKWVDLQKSQAEAARLLEMERPNMLRIYRGDQPDILLGTVEHIADVMGVEPAKLIRRPKIV